MTVTVKVDNGKIECSYDSNKDKDRFLLAFNTGPFGGIAVKLNKSDLPELIDTLQKFEDSLKSTTRR
ncbi:MAG: hypothetical protein K0R54_2265 [Clostridiaceae bacterium]|jgi:hypothetical protein|nr:hypothetical protein [Clostridiaceae bacterium]